MGLGGLVTFIWFQVVVWEVVLGEVYDLCPRRWMIVAPPLNLGDNYGLVSYYTETVTGKRNKQNNANSQEPRRNSIQLIH